MVATCAAPLETAVARWSEPCGAVAGMAGDEHQQRRGQELHEADHAEVEGRAGEIVDLPADRDRRDLAGETRQAAREQEEQEGAMGEERAGTDRRVSRYWLVWHRLFGHARTIRLLMSTCSAWLTRTCLSTAGRPANLPALRLQRRGDHNHRGLGTSCCGCNRHSAFSHC